MAQWPPAVGGGETSGPSSSNTGADQVTAVAASASTNTKGSYVTARTLTADVDGLLIGYSVATANVRSLIDIAVGGAGSEVTVVEDLHYSAAAGLTQWFYVPVSAPSGTVVRARHACSTGSTTAHVAIHEVKGGWFVPPPGGGCVTWGADATDSGGTLLDAGAAANTFGTIVQLSASTANDVRAVCIVMGGNANTAPTGANFAVRILVGGSGSEVEIATVGFRASTNADAYGPLGCSWLPCSIPAGSRVSARLASGSTDATDRTCDVVVYGLES